MQGKVLCLPWCMVPAVSPLQDIKIHMQKGIWMTSCLLQIQSLPALWPIGTTGNGVVHSITKEASGPEHGSLVGYVVHKQQSMVGRHTKRDSLVPASKTLDSHVWHPKPILGPGLQGNPHSVLRNAMPVESAHKNLHGNGESMTKCLQAHQTDQVVLGCGKLSNTEVSCAYIVSDLQLTKAEMHKLLADPHLRILGV